MLANWVVTILGPKGNWKMLNRKEIHLTQSSRESTVFALIRHQPGNAMTLQMNSSRIEAHETTGIAGPWKNKVYAG
jgi:hypothetical protein